MRYKERINPKKNSVKPFVLAVLKKGPATIPEIVAETGLLKTQVRNMIGNHRNIIRVKENGEGSPRSRVKFTVYELIDEN